MVVVEKAIMVAMENDWLLWKKQSHREWKSKAIS
jgi:hypothetical protein